MNLSRIFIILTFLLTISSIVSNIALPIGNTFMWWMIYAITIFVMIKYILMSNVFTLPETKQLNYIKYFAIWCGITIIRSCFAASNYWEWKSLIGNAFVFFLPLVSFLSLKPSIIAYITRNWIYFILPIFILFIPFFSIDGDGEGRYLVPISFLILFFRDIPRKWKLILIIFTIIVLLANFDARSHIIKFSVSIILAIGLYFNAYKLRRILKSLYFAFLLLPIFLFTLGASGIFNIFKMDDYLKAYSEATINQNGREIGLTTDTRTFIYEEVLTSSIKNNYYIWGRTFAKGNDSEAFGDENKKLGLNSNQRFSNEVAIANIFTWMGIAGVIFYFLIYAKASYLAIFRSRNQYSRMLGIYLLFRWCYAWVEDFTNFDLSYFYLWIIIGLCYSQRFRTMSEIQTKIWLRSIFTLKKVHIKYSQAIH